MKTTLTGKWAIDTNLLIYALDRKSPYHIVTKDFFNKFLSQEIQPFVSTQNITEAIYTLTKKYKKNLNEAIEAVENLLTNFNFNVISPLPSTVITFYDLSRGAKQSRDVYDLFLAATLIDNHCPQLLTVNHKDFKLISGLTVVNPFK